MQISSIFTLIPLSFGTLIALSLLYNSYSEPDVYDVKRGTHFFSLFLYGMGTFLMLMFLLFGTTILFMGVLIEPLQKEMSPISAPLAHFGLSFLSLILGVLCTATYLLVLTGLAGLYSKGYLLIRKHLEGA